MSRVLLIRHGETPWNRQLRWQGHADIELSEEGRQQALDLATHLARGACRPAVIYSSDLRRARDTAARLGEAFGLEVVIEPRWREIDVGCWTGLTRHEVQQAFAAEWARMLAGEDLARGGGETFGGFVDRVVETLEEVRQRHAGETALVVTHGGAIRAALLHARGLPVTRLREVSGVRNTSLTELTHDGGSWTVARTNDVAHLGFVAEPLSGAP